MNIIDEEELRKVLENINVKPKRVLSYDIIDAILFYVFLAILGLLVFAILILLLPIILLLLIMFCLKSMIIKLWRKIWKKEQTL